MCDCIYKYMGYVCVRVCVQGWMCMMCQALGICKRERERVSESVSGEEANSS